VRDDLEQVRAEQRLTPVMETRDRVGCREAAANIDDEIVIVGSQAILGAHPDARAA
jgi:hypothetical protein